jgi:hypothetical protein
MPFMYIITYGQLIIWKQHRCLRKHPVFQSALVSHPNQAPPCVKKHECYPPHDLQVFNHSHSFQKYFSKNKGRSLFRRSMGVKKHDLLMIHSYQNKDLKCLRNQRQIKGANHKQEMCIGHVWFNLPLINADDDEVISPNPTSHGNQRPPPDGANWDGKNLMDFMGIPAANTSME